MVKAQIPLNLDMTIAGKFHIETEKEKIMNTRDVVSYKHFSELAYTKMGIKEKIEYDKVLKYRGSAKDSEGRPIPGNENLASQKIDPRTPLGFGDPFFRKMNVELNAQMGMSPFMKEALKNQTSDFDLKDRKISNDVFDFLDRDGDGYEDGISHWEIFARTNTSINNANSMEQIDDVINRTFYHNGTWVDFVESTRCLTSYGNTVCSTTSYEYNEYQDSEVTLFPNGVCPNACDCVRSLGVTKKEQQEMEDRCYEACAGHTLKDVFECNMLRTTGNQVRTRIKALLAEKDMGEGVGLKVKRSHPLGRDLVRFMGVF